MTDVLTTPRPADTPDDDAGLFAKYLALPGAIRWMTAAAIGMLLLSIVQEISGEGSSVLTEPGTSGAMLRFAVPILLAGLGGLFSERAGVVNIGLEGMMILGTWFGAWGTVNFDSPWAGLVCAAVGGALGGLI
ncbi:MAG: ABC transporter permease, partial [Ilumatobacter sp.]